jgi:hypothetical protein
MPKRARYPLFLLGLAVIIGGSIFLNSLGAGTVAIATIVGFGFLLLFLSVAIR